MVRRDADARDRRVNRIFLEPTSKQMIARLRKLNHRMNETILAGLVDEKLEITAKTLAGMKHNLLAFLQADPA